MTAISNKVIWITGGSSGIGAALALHLASKKCKLVLSARSADALLQLRNSTGLSDENCLILPFDLADTSTIDDLTAKVIQQFGRIDILINNGGISQREYASKTDLAVDRRIMEVNFFGTVAVTKSVLPHMLSQKSGHIVVLSSIAGKFGFYLRSAYSASKHALHGFFESLRMEVHSDNIKVLIVCPGKIKTNISVNAITGKGEKHGRMDDSTNEGMSAEKCAARIIGAIERNKEEAFIGGKELRAVWVKRFFPSIFSRMIRKQKPE